MRTGENISGENEITDPTVLRHLQGDGFFRVTDGLLLSCSWRSLANPRAHVIILHGAIEHCRCYEWLENTLIEAGYAVYKYDQRGLGLSQGETGDIHKFHQYSADLDVFANLLSEAGIMHPRFVIGHSMGSLVGIEYAASYPDSLDGLVLMSTPAKLADGTPWWIQSFAKVARIFLPKLKVSPGIRDDAISHDPTILSRLKTDHLRLKKVTVRWVVEFLEAIGNLSNHLTMIAIPTLILHSKEDEIADYLGVQVLEANLVTDEKTVHVFSGMHHELHNEAEGRREEVFTVLIDWLNRHVEQS